MILRNFVVRRYLTTEKPNIGQIFIQDDVQKLLADITRFEEAKVFSKRKVPKLKTPKLMFMTDEQLKRAKKESYENVKARLQMPPVLEPDTSKPKILSKDEEIVGYTKFKIMFIDISHGYSSRNRLMSIREADGTLRLPTHAERARLNHIFYPSDYTSIDEPKMFQDKNLQNLLERKEYLYILNRACMQYEPDDPKYYEITSKTYDWIDQKNDFDLLKSTRHFGPMSLYLVYNKKGDNLILHLLTKKLVEDAAKLVKIYNLCHGIQFDNQDPMNIVKNYAENHSEQINLSVFSSLAFPTTSSE